VRTVHAALATTLRRAVARGDLYTTGTASLVRTFQTRAGLPVTGRVDALTFARLTWAAQASR
jgi:peptidoglycan hydrolase-like protein with peptidoglycan-binding domain